MLRSLGGLGAGVWLPLTGHRDGILGSCSGGSFRLDLVDMVGNVLVTPSFPSTFFFFRGAIIRLLLGFGDPGWNGLVFTMDKTRMGGVHATHQEWSDVHNIHKDKIVVNEITHNRECCHQKHDTSYSDIQQYKMLSVTHKTSYSDVQQYMIPVKYFNINLNIHDVTDA